MTTLTITETVAAVLALMVAIIGHEIMHGYVAYRYGDTTAKNEGRLSINPLVHIDLVGTIIVPAFLYFSGAPFMFVWAKPFPIYLQRVIQGGGYKAAMHVSLAGIAYNFTLAFLAAALIGMFDDLRDINNIFEYFFVYFLFQTLIYNTVLGIFNLYPIPPLDGSHALTYFAIMQRWYGLARMFESLERYGMIILILIIATPLSHYVFLPIRYVLSLLY